ncbi:hypothetical protein ACSJLZ_004234 [Serratia bockelmannii]|uniref:hypothetical protein n=1 Tax=Serratia bockelmannii TaxID=2703793 RepID=UPI003F6B4632
MDAKQIAKGIAEGVGSLPTSLGYSIRRTWEGSGVVGSSLKERNFRETERFVSLIRSAVDKQEPIRKLVMIVINDFYAKLDAGSKSAVAGEINRAEGFIAGRSVTQFFIANKIASNIIRKGELRPCLQAVYQVQHDRHTERGYVPRDD